MCAYFNILIIKNFNVPDVGFWICYSMEYELSMVKKSA